MSDKKTTPPPHNPQHAQDGAIKAPIKQPLKPCNESAIKAPVKVPPTDSKPKK